MIRLTAVSVLAIFLTGCASFSQIPIWSEDPGQCSYENGKWNDWSEEKYIGDKVYQGSRKFFGQGLICAERPSVVKLPSYIELLELPPAKYFSSVKLRAKTAILTLVPYIPDHSARIFISS